MKPRERAPKGTDFELFPAEDAARYDPARRAALGARRIRLWRSAYKPLLPRIRSARSMLDYGCGAGEFLEFLRRETRAPLTGWDPSRAQAAIARARCSCLSRIRVATGPGGPAGRHDIVFCTNVIEHVPDHELGAFVRRLAALTAPDGLLVISTPNGVNPFAYAAYMSLDTTHLRMHSPATLAALLAAAGFTIRMVGREHPRAYDLPSLLKTAAWAAFALPLRIGAMASTGGVRGLTQPLTMAASFYVVAARKGRSAGFPPPR